MKIEAKTVNTPVGTYHAPLNPNFEKELDKCDSIEDLYEIVEDDKGFINPDAFNEVMARGKYFEYLKWKADEN